MTTSGSNPDTRSSAAERARSSFATLAEAFDHQARRYGSRTFLRQKRDKLWRDFSWGAIAEAAAKLRAGLLRFGLKPGDRVAILADNSPEWVIVDQAALGMGAIVVPLYTTSSAEETRHVINDSGARVVAAGGDELVKKLLGFGSSIPGVEAIIAIHPGAGARERSVGTAPVMTLESASAAQPAPVGPGKRDVLATFIYTSGTTGPSKGVMLTHGNILSNAADSIEVLALNETDSTLSFLPVAHSFERTGGYYAVMLAGGTISYAEGLAQVAGNLLETNPTVLLVVPRLLEVIHTRVRRMVETGSPVRRRLFEAALGAGMRATEYRLRGEPLPAALGLKMALYRRLVFHRIRAIFGNRLRYLVSGGAPLSPDIYRFFAAAEVPLVEGYGLTEASPVVSVNLLGKGTRIGTVGRPLPSVRVKTAPDGELLVHGPNVMKGYFRLEQDTREAIDAEGWLHTGDIAEIDSDGFIRITDRKKEIIVLSGGKNVSPAKLENKLVGDSFIAQACVIGDRRKHLVALLVPNFENLRDFLKENGLEGRPVEEITRSPQLRALFQARLRELNKQLSDVEAIVGFSILSEPFTQENGELTPTLKLRRKVIQQHYRDRIEALYGGSAD
jgi:long-chain acyl-CoA synthetase